MVSMEWLGMTGFTVFVAAGTGILVWLVMHLHLELAVLREREAHYREGARPAQTPARVPDEWFEARLANVMMRLAEQRVQALPAPVAEPLVIEAVGPVPTARRRRGAARKKSASAIRVDPQAAVPEPLL